MAIVNHMKGTSIHLRHSSLSQSRQKFNSHICQLLWERTPTCAHEAVRQLKDTSACVEIIKNARHRASQNRKLVCVSTCVLVSDDLWMIIDIRLSDTCKQGRRRPHVVEPAVYLTTNLDTRTGSAFTLSHRLTRSRLLSLPSSLAPRLSRSLRHISTSNSSKTALKSSFYAPPFLCWLA